MVEKASTGTLDFLHNLTPKPPHPEVTCRIRRLLSRVARFLWSMRQYIYSNHIPKYAFLILCGVFLLINSSTPMNAGPRKARKLYHQARHAELSKDYDRALQLYEQALDEHNGHQGYLLSVRRMRFVAAQAHVDRGQVLRSQEEFKRALKEFQKALEVDPASSVAAQERQRTVRTSALPKCYN